jgi:hypothetical protein
VTRQRLQRLTDRDGDPDPDPERDEASRRRTAAVGATGREAVANVVTETFVSIRARTDERPVDR